MSKRKIVKIILILIITFLILQLVACSINHVSGFQHGIESSKSYFQAIYLNPGVLVFLKENYKLSVQHAQIKYSMLTIHGVSVQDIYSVKLLSQNHNFDYRKNIRQSIPHYFNGSAYKSLS